MAHWRESPLRLAEWSLDGLLPIFENVGARLAASGPDRGRGNLLACLGGELDDTTHTASWSFHLRGEPPHAAVVKLGSLLTDLKFVLYCEQCKDLLLII